jgi:hypothetical protein
VTTTFWEAMCSPTAMAKTEGRAPHTGGPFMPKTDIPSAMLPKATGCREIVGFRGNLSDTNHFLGLNRRSGLPATRSESAVGCANL